MTDTECKDLHARVTALEKLFEERELRYRERWKSQEEAAKVFKDSLDTWKAQANEWRGTMSDRERNFLPKNLGTSSGYTHHLGFVLAVI